MSYYNHWSRVIDVKDKIDIVVNPIIERYIGMPFEETVLESLRTEVDNALVRAGIEASCQIKVSTEVFGSEEYISKIHIEYLHS